MFKRVLCAIALVLLAGCGGGGEGNTPNGDLAVYYSYSVVPLTFQRFTPLSIKPDLGQLDSNKPHFGVSSGRLPDGLKLNENTGEITGVPTSLQNDVRFSIGLRVAGFTGELKRELRFSITELKFSYGNPPIKLQLGETLRSKVVAGISTTLESREPTAGTLAFSVDPAAPLPEGLVLNASTGEITGTPTQLSPPRDVIVRMSVSYGGVSNTYSATLNFSVYAPANYARYPQSPGSTYIYVQNNKAFMSGVPEIVGGYPGDTLDSFQIVPNAPGLYAEQGINDLPAGLVFDPATGIISGVPAVAHPLNTWGNPCTAIDLANRSCPQYYWTTVSAVFHRGTYSTTKYMSVRFRVD